MKCAGMAMRLGPRRAATAILAIVAGLSLAVVTWADAPATAPLPPLPDDEPPATAPPATFEPVTAHTPADGSRPLSGRGPTAVGGPRPPVTPPFGDWTALVAVAAAFAVLAAFRMRSMRRVRPLPPDVFELLGEASLGGQRAVRVVRFGPRALLIGVSAAGCQTLAEIDDPQATEKIAAACRGERPAARGRPEPTRVAVAPPTGGEAA